MPIHPGILAWKISWTEEPKRLQSMGLQRVGHDLVTKQQQQYRMEVVDKKKRKRRKEREGGRKR